MTGFFGGRSAERADINLHVAAENYGVVEDIHQLMMHALVQYLQQSAMAPGAHISHRFWTGVIGGSRRRCGNLAARSAKTERNYFRRIESGVAMTIGTRK
jgi:hypothetical protein